MKGGALKIRNHVWTPQRRRRQREISKQSHFTTKERAIATFERILQVQRSKQRA